MSPMTVNLDDRNSEIKKICRQYYAAEIDCGNAARLLGLIDSAKVSSREVQYYTSLR